MTEKKIKKLIKGKKFSQLIDGCKKLYEAETDEKEKEKLREVYIYWTVKSFRTKVAAPRSLLITFSQAMLLLIIDITGFQNSKIL